MFLDFKLTFVVTSNMRSNHTFMLFSVLIYQNDWDFLPGRSLDKISHRRTLVTAFTAFRPRGSCFNSDVRYLILRHSVLLGLL